MSKINSGCYKKGHKETQEEKEKRIQNTIIARRNDPNCLAKLKEDNPYIFNSWRGILYTENGRNKGCSEEWKNFKIFFDDVSPTYEKGLKLTRKNFDLPFSKENFVWLTADEVGRLNKNTILLEYNGEVKSIYDWAEQFNLSRSGIKQRYHRAKNYDAEEIIFGKTYVRNKNKKEPKDFRVIDSHFELKNKAVKMLGAYNRSNKEKGFNKSDFDAIWLLDNIITKCCVYCGDNKRVGCDRVDNSKGHFIDNVVPCCYDCNVARANNFSFDEMKVIGESIKKVKEARQVEVKNSNTHEIVEKAKEALKQKYSYDEKKFDIVREKKSRRKINKLQIQAIKDMYSTDRYSCAKLGEVFNVSASLIHRVITDNYILNIKKDEED